MSEGEFIHTKQHLDDRNDWLVANAEEVDPFLGSPRDCIIFTYDRTEPSDRATTRYGGLPYWPKNRSWPMCSGHGLHSPGPMPFAGQIDFRRTPQAASMPGDVLVLHYCFVCTPWDSSKFGSSTMPKVDSDPDNLTDTGCVLTWLSEIPEDELILAADLPKIREDLVVGPFYGSPQVAKDYITPEEAYGGNIAGEPYTFLQFTLQGTKIGGYPPRIQGNALMAGETMLCAFGSIQPFGLGEEGYRGEACWGDMGSLIVSASKEDPNILSWSIESY